MIHEEPYSNALQDVLANLLEAVPPEELIAQGSGLSHSHSPPELTNGHGTRGKTAAANKKRKVTNPRTKENVAVASTSTVSACPLVAPLPGARARFTSLTCIFHHTQMPSFADLPDLHDLDGFEDFSEEDSSRGRRGAYAKASAKVQSLAKQLSDATGMHLNKCAETISRMPKEDIQSIGASGSLPESLLLSNAVEDISTEPTPRPTAPKPKKSTPRPSVSVDGGAGSGGEGSSGPPVKKVTRIQRPHDPNRPNFSYSALIGQAILAHPDRKMRLGEIYDYVTSHYSYYKKNECGWQNSIRHNLSLQPVFRKIPDHTIPGKKGCWWEIIESEEWRFAGGGWKKIEKGELVPSRDGGPPILVGPGVQVKMSAKKLAAQKRAAAEEAALAEASGGEESMAIGDGDESANEGDVYSDDE